MDYLKATGIIGIACLWAFAVPVSAAGGVQAANGPSGGLVSRWSGEDNAMDSAGKHHGRVVGAVKYAKGMSGKAFSLDGSAYVDFGNPAGLRITGNQTIAMWLKPARLGLRQNPLAKAYGGEGTLTLEPTGMMNYIYGISGRNAQPYASITSETCFKVGKWTHVAVVRDFKVQKLQFYIDGVLRKEKVPKFTKTTASSLSMYLGKGYVENYSGLIDEVCIWNRALDAWEVSAAASSGLLVAPRISRDSKLDAVRPADGSVLLGTIDNSDWSITTSYGKFKIPAARVVGFIAKSAGLAATSQPAASDVQMVLTDGQVLVGKLSVSLVRLKLPSDQILKIPIVQIRQCGYRIGPEKPVTSPEARKPDAKFPATVMLSSGDNLAWDSSGITLRLKTAFGMLDLRAKTVSSIAAAGSNRWRVHLRDSSTIIGTLALEKFKLKLKLGKDISVSSSSVRFLAFPGAIVTSPDAATVLLRDGGRLSANPSDKKLTVQTDYGLVSVSMADIWTIRRQSDGTAKLTTQKASVVTGKLTATSLAMVLGSGVKFNVPIEQIKQITFPRKLPGETIKKVEALIKELGDDSAAKRKAAAQKLIAMGKDTLIVLKRYSNSTNPAVSKGVKEVIDTLEGRVKPKKPHLWVEKRGEVLIRN